MLKIIYYRVAYLVFGLLLNYPGSIKAQGFFPPGIPPYQIQSNNSVGCGYFFLSPWFINGAAAYEPHLMIVEESGHLLWYKHIGPFSMAGFDFKILENGNPGYFHYDPFGGNTYFNLLDSSFNLIDTLICDSLPTDLHDIYQYPNGEFLMIGLDNRTMDLSVFNFAGGQGDTAANVAGMHIQRLDGLGNSVWDWNSWDHIAVTEVVEGLINNPSQVSYIHINSLTLDVDSNIVASCRNINTILKIDANSGAIIWRFGGQNSDFLFVNDSGFSAQHSARFTVDGKLAVYDNGNLNNPSRSRYVEYELDTVLWIANKTREIYHSPNIFAMATGNIQHLPNKRKLVGWGLNGGGPKPAFTVYDSLDNVDCELTLASNYTSYRSSCLNPSFNFVQPLITCTDWGGGQLLLQIPGGATDFMWSTGETTSSILVNQPGDYWVYSNYGIGMISSEMISVDTAITGGATCNLTSFEEQNQIMLPAKLIGIFDVLGRRVEAIEPGNLYLYRYNNGQVERRIILK